MNRSTKEYGSRFIAKCVEISNNSYETQLNNNDILIGSSGTGKTSSYVFGNISGMYGSYIIADTKGNLAKRFGPILRKSGYDVKTIDLIDLDKSVGYNPMDFVRQNVDGSYNDQDIHTIAELMSPVTNYSDPYWETGAMNVICSLLALCYELDPPERHNLCTVGEYAADLGFLVYDEDGKPIVNGMRRLQDRFEEAHLKDPNSFAWKKFQRYKDIQRSDKTWSCIINFVHKALSLYDIKAFDTIFTNPNKVDLSKPGKEKCAYFVNVSDSNRSMDPIANMFYSQLFQALIAEADSNPDSRLDVPVRIILDDFATNVYIPDFDKLISVIRSREISVSIILQSITQLNALYGNNRARTIINNCDHLVYCGGHDFETACYISNLANVPLEKVIDMPLDKQFILVRGQKPIYAERLAPDAMVIDTDAEISPPISSHTVEPVVLSNVPKSLLLLTGAVDKRYYRFCFAYDIDENDVIYATIRLPLKCVDVKENKCTITLGAPEEIYTCHIGDMQGYTHITAQMIAATYRQNRSRYIALMKKRPTRINPQHKDDN